MTRVVLDTNILVSALISAAGNEALVVLAANQGLLIPCFSEEIATEYAEVLLRPKFGFPRDQVDALLSMLRSVGELVKSPPPVRISPDPDDDRFISCALASGAKFLVTGNKRHFPLIAGVEVVSASELLEFITLEI